MEMLRRKAVGTVYYRVGYMEYKLGLHGNAAEKGCGH